MPDCAESGGDFDVTDLAGGRRYTRAIFAQTFDVRLDRLANLSFDFFDRSARCNTAR
jgi:hypothetical protein